MADGWGRDTWSSGSWGEGVDVTVRFGGWGRGSWGEGSWGQSLSLQATGEVGSVVVEAGSGINVTGVEATTVIGNTVVSGDADSINVLGNAATGQVGTLSVEAGAIATVTGVQGTSELGTAGVKEGANAFPIHLYLLLI